MKRIWENAAMTLVMNARAPQLQEFGVMVSRAYICDIKVQDSLICDRKSLKFEDEARVIRVAQIVADTIWLRPWLTRFQLPELWPEDYIGVSHLMLFLRSQPRCSVQQGRSQRGGVGGCDTPPIIRPVGKIRVLWAKLRRKEREEKERGARKKEKERKKNWRKEKDKERKEKRRKKERKRRKIERKKKRGYAYVIMQAKIDSVDKCRHLQVSLL